MRFNQSLLFNFFVIVAVFLAVNNLWSQKVGVVLSGGGAKGVTHIGVLKALEENGIPIDFITGTSMGAVIGGLYASGYSPGQIDSITNSRDFHRWISGEVEKKYNFYFKKQEENASWVTFKFDYDSVLQPQIPTNIISPVSMDFALMEIYSGASAAAGYNFDSLLIPFRCVASDISENKAVVMRDGDLGEAIRASMTFPFYFKPIKIDGKLMFDGGMYNNFPADVLISEFAPDINIGSKAASNYDPPREDDLISQIQNMLMENTDYNIVASGVLIEPQLWSVNVVDFSHSRAFIDSGYVAANRKMDTIKLLIKDAVKLIV